MITELANEIYDLRYSHEMTLEQYKVLLQKGLEFIRNNPTDKLFISRFYKGDDLKAVNLALEYNQEVMIRFLSD